MAQICAIVESRTEFPWFAFPLKSGKQIDIAKSKKPGKTKMSLIIKPSRDYFFP